MCRVRMDNAAHGALPCIHATFVPAEEHTAYCVLTSIFAVEGGDCGTR